MLQNFAGVSKANGLPSNNVVEYKIGDILISNIRPYLKKIWLANQNGGCSSDIIVLSPCENYDGSFVYYLLANDGFVSYVMSGAKGLKMPRGDKQQILKYGISIPSLKEQRKIAALLDLFDQRIETQKKIIEKYESLIRGLYHSCFCNSENTIIKLRDVVAIVKGKQVNGENLLENGQYYVMNGGIEPSGYLNEYNTPADTISISEGGNSCGYVQYNKEPFWSGGHCYSLMPKSDSICYRFLYHFLKYKENDIMALRIGSGLPNVQKKDLERFEVQLPSLERQREVTTLLDAISAKLDLEWQLHHVWQSQKQYLLGSLFI